MRSDPSAVLSSILDIRGPSLLELDESLGDTSSAQIAGALRSRGFYVFIATLAQGGGEPEEGLIGELERGFRFPDYFGGNWNSVEECINDLSWLPGDGYCCVLRNYKVLQEGNERAAGIFASIISSSSARWAKAGKRFCVVLSP